MPRGPIHTPATPWIRAALLVLGVCPCPSVAQNPAVLRPTVPLWPRITVEPVASPVPVPAQGRLHLVYELRLTSFDSREVRVDRIDVLTAPGSTRAIHGQRFAFDWVKYRGDESGTPDPATYGSEVVAVADARVVTAMDGIPDNWLPGERPASPRDRRAVAITAETTRGNTVALDLGGGRYAHYVHLKPGSVRVKTGERVRRGQVLGQVGNSGNSNGPHLHFGISDTPGLGGNGLPFVFDSFELLMAVPPRPDWREHVVRIPPGQRTRRNEMPLSHWAIVFP